MSRIQSIIHHGPALRLTGLILLIGFVGIALPTIAQDAEPPQAEPAVTPQAQTDADDTQAVSEEDEADASADDSAEQAALESELASAKRFEEELAKLLQADGQLDATQGDLALTKLASLATRCGILANSAMHDEVRYVLLGYQARALSALISLEPVDPPQGASYVEQLADVAEQIAQLDLPGSQATADYWALLVAMDHPSQTKSSPAERRALAQWSLSRYIETHQDDEHAAEYLLDTRLSLAQLLDQRGAQHEVAKLLDQIGSLPAKSPRALEAHRLRESVARIGTPIQFESISTQLVNWRSSDHLGKPVLIHVYADAVEPSLRMIDAISRSIVEGNISGIAVVSLRVGEPVAGSASPPWPTLPVQLEPDGVLDQLGVSALPTLAWLDEQGKLASIGTTAAVLDQLKSIRAKADNATNPKDPQAPGTSQDQDANAQTPAPEPTDPAQPSEQDTPQPDTP